MAATGWKAYRNVSQSIPSSTKTAITFDTEIFDTDAFITVSSSTVTIPVGKGGKYLIIGGGYWASASSWFRSLFISKNGTLDSNIVASTVLTQASDAAQIITTILDLVAGDVIRLLVEQTSGGAVNFGSQSGELNAWITGVLLGT